MKLTLAQHCALVDLSDKSMSAYSMGASLRTLWALQRKGLVRPDGGPGSMAFPRSMTWTITDAGRRALSEQETR